MVTRKRPLRMPVACLLLTVVLVMLPVTRKSGGVSASMLPPVATKAADKLIPTGEASANGIYIDAPFIDQRGKYPNGCESVAAVMALRYLGATLSVEDFIDHWLPQSDAPHFDGARYISADPNKSFLGNPYAASGWGCYAPVICHSVNQAVGDAGFVAIRPENAGLEALAQTYVKKHIPVLIWATQDMRLAYCGKRLYLRSSGRTMTWMSPMHCLLMTGVDETHYYFNDSLSGKNTAYDKARVEAAYAALGCQAVVITRGKDGGR